MRKTAARCGIRVSVIAPTAPIRPPSPTAALRSPTPLSPRSSSWIEATTMRVVSMPRTKVWPQKSRKTTPTSGCRRSARSALVTAIPCTPATPAVPPRASRSSWNRRPARIAAAPTKASATTAHAATGPALTTIAAPTRGPTKPPAPSPMLLLTLAATSSDGVRASAGIRPVWIGRTSTPAAAPIPASANANPAGAPTARTRAVDAAAAARTRLTATSARSPRKRATGTSANGPTSAGGTIRTTPRIPTPIAPPAA